MLFEISNGYMKKASDKAFYLHDHDHYEIYVFEMGDSAYAVEGADYPLEKGDMIFIRPGEMHRVHHRSECEYKRMVIGFDDEFFKLCECEHYKDIFWNRKPGEKNKISAKTAKSAGIADVISRMQDILPDYDKAYMRSLLVQLLYLAHKNDCFSTENTGKKRVKEIVSFINEHYAEKLTLDEIAEEFFITKYHLARIFKEATGHTVNEYIRIKRMRRVEELSEDSSLSEAALKSGYKDYSSFYRAYIKAKGNSPRKSLKKGGKEHISG